MNDIFSPAILFLCITYKILDQATYGTIFTPLKSVRPFHSGREYMLQTSSIKGFWLAGSRKTLSLPLPTPCEIRQAPTLLATKKGVNHMALWPCLESIEEHATVQLVIALKALPLPFNYFVILFLIIFVFLKL